MKPEYGLRYRVREKRCDFGEEKYDDDDDNNNDCDNDSNNNNSNYNNEKIIKREKW